MRTAIKESRDNKGSEKPWLGVSGRPIHEELPGDHGSTILTRISEPKRPDGRPTRPDVKTLKSSTNIRGKN